MTKRERDRAESTAAIMKLMGLTDEATRDALNKEFDLRRPPRKQGNMDYIKAEIRLEGNTNRNWTLTKSDGSTEKYYSIEGSPQRDGDDARVYDYDTKLAEFLDKISTSWFEVDDDEVVEYTVDLVNNQGRRTLYEQI